MIASRVRMKCENQVVLEKKILVALTTFVEYSPIYQYE